MTPDRLRRYWRDSHADAALIAREAPTEPMRREWQARADAAQILAAVFEQPTDPEPWEDLWPM